MNKDYWFYLESYVYVSFDDHNVLLINSLDKNNIKSSQPEIYKLMKSLFDPENCGVIKISKDINKECWNFIEYLRDNFMCDIIEICSPLNKPVQIIPYNNIISNARQIENSITSSKEGNNYLSYLTELTLMINTQCQHSCLYCDKYYLQFNCCTKYKEQNIELGVNDLYTLFNQIKQAPIGRVNIVGGDISLYSNMNELLSLLQPYKDEAKFYFHYLSIDKEVFNFFEKGIIVIVDFPIKKNQFEKVYDFFNDICTYSFILKSDDDYKVAVSYIQRYNISKYELKPFYTGHNISFFEQNVYMHQQDIIDSIEMREIQKNEILNKNYFGRLFVLPDGAVKSNMSSNVLGYLQNSTIVELLYTEIYSLDSNWFGIRNKQPCCDCLYQYLCPPMSNYETQLKKNNLCHIHTIK